ncbi:hypothetical protein J3P71_19350 [Rhizobium leguminosarum]|uniref:colicin immunity protein n=1 Tax=Rhizobium leguminosarum TaxID=384 RepID=UPI001442A1DB|nr:colicin immunity protein [Rhizobium leguminosarum]MBY5841089.1 colicin immunity protein [Rhizobium leguminosarum]NKM80408.1 colicin immunity protein [Rhizobium leguminosarum bv. viciae]QSZ07013.1 hypothetical protein J3P71_19350 [Rhizobium leguminosarum]
MSIYGHWEVHVDAEDFFRMKRISITPDAAVEVCRLATERGLLISRIEGGLGDARGFESRLDCIWDGDDPPVDCHRMHQNNFHAATYVREKAGSHNAFVILAVPFDRTG